MMFDTDILVWYLRGNQPARTFLADVPHHERRLPAMVYFELLQGCRSRREIRAVRKFAARNFPGIVPISEQISHRAGSLLERHSPTHGLEAADALIASAALVNRLPLATGNARHYRPIPGLELVEFTPV